MKGKKEKESNEKRESKKERKEERKNDDTFVPCKLGIYEV